jgi:hypothetical protein
VIELYIVPQDKIIFLTSNHVNSYGWNLVFVQCVAINAALNPVIYCWRIRKMRNFYSRDRIRAWSKRAGNNIQQSQGPVEPETIEMSSLNRPTSISFSMSE